MDALVKLNSSTSGRDKVLKLWQYTLRLVWPILSNIVKDENAAKQLQSVESTIVLVRKFLRFGLSADMLYMSLMDLSKTNGTLKFLVPVSKTSMSFYFFCDHLVCLNRIGFKYFDDTKWSQLSNQFWLSSIAVNLIRDLYELEKTNKRRKSFEEEHKLKKPSNSIVKSVSTSILINKALSIDLVKNSCDFLLPLNNLGFITLSPSLSGLIGIVSSTAAIVQLVDPSLRL